MTAKMLLEQYMLNAMRLGLCQKPTKDAFGVSCVITRNQKMEKLFSLRSTSLSILERA